MGLALPAIVVGIPVTVALRRANQDGLLGNITHYTVRLVGHERLRSRADVALVILGVVMFMAGAGVQARPFAARRFTLFIAVPLAAAAGIAVLRVVALACAVVIALVGSAGDGGGPDLLDNFIPGSSGVRRKRRK